MEVEQTPTPTPPPVKTVLPDKTLHESAVEFLLRYVRDKQPDVNFEAAAQRHLEAIYAVDAAEATGNLKDQYPSEDGTVFITSLPRPAQSIAGGEVSVIRHDQAAAKLVAGTHRIATEAEVEQFKAAEEAKTQAGYEKRLADAKAAVSQVEATNPTVTLPAGATPSVGTTGAPISTQQRTTTPQLIGEPLKPTSLPPRPFAPPTPLK